MKEAVSATGMLRLSVRLWVLTSAVFTSLTRSVGTKTGCGNQLWTDGKVILVFQRLSFQGFLGGKQSAWNEEGERKTLELQAMSTLSVHAEITRHTKENYNTSSALVHCVCTLSSVLLQWMDFLRSVKWCQNIKNEEKWTNLKHNVYERPYYPGVLFVAICFYDSITVYVFHFEASLLTILCSDLDPVTMMVTIMLNWLFCKTGTEV